MENMETGADSVMVNDGYKSDVQAFLEKDAPIIIRVVGVPYNCTAERVLQFLERGNSVKVMDGKDGVLIVKRPDGSYTGDALVLLAEEAMAKKALRKHLQLIDDRYIEVYRISKNVAKSILNWSIDEQSTGQLEQQAIISGSIKNCLHLRNLHFDAQVEDILQFLGKFSRYTSPQDVHIVSNRGMPTGEAFIHMNSECSAFMVVQLKHRTRMVIGTRTRHIQVIQCTGDLMSKVLARDRLAPKTDVSQVAKTQSPPGTISPAMSLNQPNNTQRVNEKPKPDIWMMAIQLAIAEQQQRLRRLQAVYQQQQTMLATVAKNGVVPPVWPPNPPASWAQKNPTHPLHTVPKFYMVPTPQPQAAAANVPRYSAGHPQYIPQPYRCNVPSISPPATATNHVHGPNPYLIRSSGYPQYVPQPYRCNVPSITFPATATNHVLNANRGWNLAFPGTDANGNLVKRPPAATRTVTAPFYN